MSDLVIHRPMNRHDSKGDEHILANTNIIIIRDNATHRSSATTQVHNKPSVHRPPATTTTTTITAHSLRNIMNRRCMISSLLILLQLITITAAQEECNCSPQKFVFKLALSAACPPLPPPFPPNDVFGAGVKDYTCTIGPEPIPSAASQEMVTSEDESLSDSDGRKMVETMYELFTSEEIESAQHLFTKAELTTEKEKQSGTTGDTFTASMQDLFPEYFNKTVNNTDEFFEAYELEEWMPIEELQWSSVNFTSSATIIEPASAADTVPVSIYSIQFLEVDNSFNVINQDSKYVRGIDFQDGDTFEYDSILSKPLAQTLGVVPYGMNMVLRGVNAAGEPVRNVFTITYTQDCGIQTFQKGEAIGWVAFVSIIFVLVSILAY